MPVVAIVGGIAAASAGVTAFAAAATIGSTILAGVQIIGGVASVLGAVTGNQKLAKIGMIASLGATAVGAVSSLVSGAAEVASGGIGLTADGAASMVDDFGSATGQGLSAAKAANVGIGSGLGTDLSALDTGASSLSGVGESLGAASNYGVAGGAGAGSGMLSQALPELAPRAAQTLTPSMDAITASDGSGFSLKAAGGANASQQLSVSGPAAGAAIPDRLALSRTETLSDAARNLVAADTGAGMFSKFGNLINANPGMAKLGAGILGGLGEGHMANQKIKQEIQAEMAKRQRMGQSVLDIQVQRGGA